MTDSAAMGPVFIVGSPRSGTTILVEALTAAGYAGFKEGNFLSLLRTVERHVDWHFETYGSTNKHVLTTHIDREKLKSDLYAVIGSAAASRYPGHMWLDKTGNPEMIEAIPILRTIWPNSRFIFSKRRAIENILSRLTKFPNLNFEYHCNDWAANMIAWSRMKAAMPDLPALDVDQRDIADAPQQTATRVCRFLGLGESATVAMTSVFTTQSPQQTDASSARRVVSLPATGWNEDQIKTFRRHCAEQMTRDGYTEDESYRVPPSGMATPPLPAPAPAPTEFRIAARWQETLSRLVTIPLKSR